MSVSCASVQSKMVWCSYKRDPVLRKPEKEKVKVKLAGVWQQVLGFSKTVLTFLPHFTLGLGQTHMLAWRRSDQY